MFTSLIYVLLMFLGDCVILPGKEVKISQEPNMTTTGALYIPLPAAGGHIGAREECPRGYWVTGIRFKQVASPVQADRVGVTGQCASDQLK